MPKFQITAEFSLGTTIEPDVSSYNLYDDSVTIDGVDSNSYFDSADFTVGGGEITFKVEAEDEVAAEQIAYQVIADGNEVEDNTGFTWAVEDVHLTVEAVEMTKEEALAIIQRLLTRLVEQGVLSAEEREAFDIVLQDV